MDYNTAKLLQMKKALLDLSAGSGWAYFIKFAEAAVRDLEKLALAEDDDTKANSLRHDARGARKFMDAVLNRVELAKSQDVNPPEDQFIDVACE
jgi:hypothetical protein